MSEQPSNPPEKKTISKGWKAFLIISILVYIAVTAYVSYFLKDNKLDTASLTRMTVIFGGAVTTGIISFKRQNMKW